MAQVGSLLLSNGMLEAQDWLLGPKGVKGWMLREGKKVEKHPGGHKGSREETGPGGIEGEDKIDIRRKNICSCNLPGARGCCVHQEVHIMVSSSHAEP